MPPPPLIPPTPPTAQPGNSAATQQALEWPRILEALGHRIATPHGMEKLASLAPLSKLGAVRHSLALIEEMKALRSAGTVLAFAEIHPLEELLQRATREGRLEAEELFRILSNLRAGRQLKAELESDPAWKSLGELAGNHHPLPGLTRQLAAALTPAGALNEAAYPQLAGLRAELIQLRERIHHKLEGLLKAGNLSAVFQDHLYTLRGRRYVLPVKADFRGQLKGIVHDVSASGATLFIEPQSVVEDTNNLAVLEKRLELEADRILHELSAQAGAEAGPLRDNEHWIGKVDLLHAQALFSEACGGTAPRVEAEGVLDLHGAAHPLLLLGEESAPGAVTAAGAGAPLDGKAGAVVRNRIRLEGRSRCMVISGANTGGKTVLLKTAGLCALLVRHGMHVPARAGSRCDLFQEVWADIGDQQSIDASLSTFSAQIQFMSGWLGDVAPGHLVLLDEMLTGTEPAQGAALAAAVLEWLLQRGATTLITTHFGELKEFAAHHEDVVNASMAFDLERLEPTYHLEVGLPGASYALHIARRHGFPGDLASQAETALANRPEALDTLLVEYHEARIKLQKEREELRRQTQRLKQREESMLRGRRNLTEREEKVRSREKGELAGEFRAAKNRIAKVIQHLQRANSLPMAGKVREELAALEREYDRPDRRKTAGDPGVPAPLATLTGLQPGTELWLPAMNRRVTLDSILDGGARARVRLGALAMEVALEEVAALPSPAREREGPAARVREGSASRKKSAPHPPAEDGGAAALLPESTREIPFPLSTGDNTLDVRGLSLEEALEEAERFFDQCTMKHVSPVMVIHGHGTGRLKSGLRDRLRSSLYVTAFRPGGEGEGRDGVTVVALNL